MNYRKYWRTKNALKPSGANMGVKGRFGRNILESVSISANSFQIESDAVHQPERVQ
jgi:hypothetical protein